MPANPISIAIVDVHALFRKMLICYLSSLQNFQVSLQTPHFSELLPYLKETHIDILLADISISETDGIKVLQTIRANFPSVKILVMSMNTDIGLISELIEFGINGYISKAGDPEELISAIETAACGRLFQNKYFTEALYWNEQQNRRYFKKELTPLLSEREKKVLQLIWEEKNSKEIADDLNLGIRSIEKIRQDMKEKLGIRSTVGLLKHGIKNKIISTKT